MGTFEELYRQHVQSVFRFCEKSHREQGGSRGPLCDAGEADYYRTQYASARTRVLQCAEIFDRLASQPGTGRANQLLSMIAGMTGDRGEATMRARRAVAACNAFNPTRSIGSVREPRTANPRTAVRNPQSDST
jgi:hypothetical protein